MSFQVVVEVDNLWPGEMKAFVVNAVRVLLVNVEGEIHAYEDRCAHQAVKLSEGKLDGTTLICKAHEWTYDLVSGDGINPAGVCLRRFAVKVEGPNVLVDVGALRVMS